MNNPRFNELLETRWQRKLTAAEEEELRALLALHPDAQAEWDREMALSETLDRLPDAPVSSNFTARVLEQVNREVLARDRPGSRWTWRRWIPKFAVAAAAVYLGMVYFGHKEAAQRAEQARSLATISDNAAIMPPELLKDMEAIRRLGESTGPDEALLALMEWTE